MLQPRIRNLTSSREASLSILAATFNQLSLCSKHAARIPFERPVLVRHASHAAQGRANGPKDSAGRRLGAKKTTSQYVIPGNIIFKQRGTKWFPGENVGMGKDHTIYSKVYGYVRYYRNPGLHPDRRYIGVALEKEGQGSKLPTPPNAPTRRRLGMYASPIKNPSVLDQEAIDTAFLNAHVAGENSDPTPVPTPPAAAPKAPLALRRGGFGIANFEIGRAAERAGIKVERFDRKNRWKAWRIRAAKVKVKMMSRAARAIRKTKGKKAKQVKKTRVS